jgi:mono/diheme cytochrome c family protein
MKRVLKWLGGLIGLVALAAGGFALYIEIDGIPRYSVEKIDLKVEPTPARIARGKKLATLLCAGCHMNPSTHQLTGKHMDDGPKQFGQIYSKNITQSRTHGIGAWTDGEIAYLIRTGVARDGRYLPPWMVKLPHISDEDLASILAFLRSDDPLVAAVDVDPPGVSRPTFLTKLLCHVAFKKLPYPTHEIAAPPLSDKVAHGRYLVAALDCYGCHSADFASMNIPEPEKSVGYFGGGNQLNDLRGRPIWSANLTPDDETGIGKWSESDFLRAIRKGFRPDNTPLRLPMGPMVELDEEEARAIYAYLRTVPKIHNAVPRQLAEAPANASEGKRLYYKYACVSCHGENGVGVGDLRQAAQHYPTPDALKAWIKNAPSIKPDTKMPAWEGVIAEADYDPLMTYVKELGTAN